MTSARISITECMNSEKKKPIQLAPYNRGANIHSDSIVDDISIKHRVRRLELVFQCSDVIDIYTIFTDL